MERCPAKRESNFPGLFTIFWIAPITRRESSGQSEVMEKVDHENYLNGIQSTFGNDGRGMISSITPQKAHQQTLTSRQYFRDNRDRITAWKRGNNTSQNPMEDGRGDRYSYDEEGQLKTAVYRALTPERPVERCEATASSMMNWATGWERTRWPPGD
jgi:hypothetical protein